MGAQADIQAANPTQNGPFNWPEVWGQTDKRATTTNVCFQVAATRRIRNADEAGQKDLYSILCVSVCVCEYFTSCHSF